MANKKGGAGSGGKVKKNERLAKAAQAREDVMAAIKGFLRKYPANCKGSFPSSWVMEAGREALADKRDLATVSFRYSSR